MISIPKCLKQQQGKYLCVNKNCEQNAIICDVKTCLCNQIHFGCSRYPYEQLIKSLKNKKSNIEWQKSLMKIQSIYNQCIKQLQRSLQVINNMLEFPGLDHEQISFMRIIEENHFDNLKPSLVLAVKQKIFEIKDRPFQISNQSINECKKYISNIIKILQVSSQPKITKQLKYSNLKSTTTQQTNDLFKDQKQIRTWLSENSEMKSLKFTKYDPQRCQFNKVTELSLEICPAQFIPIISRFTNLQKLSLSNMRIKLNDSIISVLLNSLYNLQQLRILSLRGNSLTAHGILRLSQLKQITSLDIKYNKIEEKMIQTIQNAFPNASIRFSSERD